MLARYSYDKDSSNEKAFCDFSSSVQCWACGSTKNCCSTSSLRTEAVECLKLLTLTISIFLEVSDQSGKDRIEAQDRHRPDTLPDISSTCRLEKMIIQYIQTNWYKSSESKTKTFRDQNSAQCAYFKLIRSWVSLSLNVFSVNAAIYFQQFRWQESKCP